MPYQTLRHAHMANLRRGYRLGHHSNAEYMSLKRGRTKFRSGIKAALSKARKKTGRKLHKSTGSRKAAPGAARFSRDRLARRKRAKKAAPTTASVAVSALTLAKANQRSLEAAVIRGKVHINILSAVGTYPGTRGGDTLNITADLPGHYILHSDYGWYLAETILNNHADKTALGVPATRIQLRSCNFDYLQCTWTFWRLSPWDLLKNMDITKVPYPYDMHLRFFIYELPLTSAQDDLRFHAGQTEVPDIARYYEDATIQSYGGSAGTAAQVRKYTFGRARREDKKAQAETEHGTDGVFSAGREVFSQSFILKANGTTQFKSSALAGTKGSMDAMTDIKADKGMVQFTYKVPYDMVNVEECQWTTTPLSEFVEKLVLKNAKKRLVCGMTHDWPAQLTDETAKQYGALLPEWSRPRYHQMITAVYSGTDRHDVNS